MKRFFSLMLVALVMLGVTACEQDITIDSAKSEGLSFYADLAMTRADLEQGTDGRWSTVWEGTETLMVNNFAFTNSATEPNKFSCDAEGVEALVGEAVIITMTNDSVPASGKGIMIEQEVASFDPTTTISLTANNAFFRYNYTGEATFTLSEALFVVDGEATDTITVTSEGDTWVSVLPGENVTISYSINGVKCKETTIPVVAGKIYNLGNLTEVADEFVTDVLNRELTGVTSTSYAEWSGKTVVSSAVYAGQSAGGNDSIQLRSKNSNSGIVTTKSGGMAKKIVVTWNSNTDTGRTLDVYGKSTAYSAATDLYNSTTSGTKLGSIEYGTSTELVIDGEYEYIGMRSNSGAMYVTEIKISWDASGLEDNPVVALDAPVITVSEVTASSIKVSWSAVANASSYDVAIDGSTAVNTTATEYTFENLDSGTQYSISVVAKGDGVAYSDSAAATVKQTTKAAQLIADGNYVIIASQSSVMLTNEKTGTALVARDVNVTDDTVITSSDAIWNIVWDAENEYYLIKSLETNCFLSATNGNNAYASKDTADEYCAMVIAAVDGGYNITLNKYKERILGYNASMPRFAFYTGTQQHTLLIIPAEEDSTPEAKPEESAYSYTFTEKTFSANGTVALGGLSWTLAGDGGYWGYDATKGQQFGSGSAPYKSLTLSTSGYADGVSKIVLNTSGASSTNATCTVTVGGIQVGDSINLTSTATVYTLENTTPLTGEIVISYTQTSSKAIYIKSIAIN